MMKLAVIGMGSMGKRRLRNLRAIGGVEVTGFDPRPDRVQEAAGLGFQARPLSELQTLRGLDGLIISTPPDRHVEYLRKAVDARVPAFVEASVILEGLHQIDSDARTVGVL